MPYRALTFGPDLTCTKGAWPRKRSVPMGSSHPEKAWKGLQGHLQTSSCFRPIHVCAERTPLAPCVHTKLDHTESFGLKNFPSAIASSRIQKANCRRTNSRPILRADSRLQEAAFRGPTSSLIEEDHPAAFFVDSGYLSNMRESSANSPPGARPVEEARFGDVPSR